MVQASVITGSSEKGFSYLVKKEFRSSGAEGFFLLCVVFVGSALTF